LPRHHGRSRPRPDGPVHHFAMRAANLASE
jgi:hypothetical protein